MANYTARILNNAVGALAAQQAIIATTGNNIANVNTPGYTRRVVNLETNTQRQGSAGISVGSGVRISSLTRATDEFLEKSLREATSERAAADVINQMLSRAEAPFSLTDITQTVGTQLTGFFDALKSLQADPSSIELRQNVLERTQDLVTSIKTTFGTLSDLQDEADQRLSLEVQTVNNLTSQIADLNTRISSREGSGNVAADERDRRALLMTQLAEKIGYNSLENSDGSMTISMPNGFPLVSGGTARALEVTSTPSFSSGSTPPSLSGSKLSYIVYDYDPTGGAAHLDLTQQLQGLGGTVGGLLQFRGYNAPSNTSAFDATGTLVGVAARIESITRELLTSFNFAYLGPDRVAGGAHNPSSGDLNGNSPTTPFAFFDFAYSGAKDADSDGVPSTSDLTATGIDNFSSILALKFTDPRQIAAALDAGAGSPSAASFAKGDGRNISNNLIPVETTQYVMSLGNFTFTGTLNEAYANTVNHIGSAKSTAQTNSEVSSANVVAAQARRDEVSAVSLDEEFTNLIKFQKSFQASARVIKIGTELLDEIVRLL